MGTEGDSEEVKDITPGDQKVGISHKSSNQNNVEVLRIVRLSLLRIRAGNYRKNVQKSPRTIASGNPLFLSSFTQCQYPNHARYIKTHQKTKIKGQVEIY